MKGDFRKNLSNFMRSVLLVITGYYWSLLGITGHYWYFGFSVVLAVVFRPDGAQLAVSGLDAQITFWDVRK